jgi:surfeit locus 1 family protein
VTLTRRRWVVLVATLAAVALTARLGFWQVSRAHQKLAMQAEVDANARLPALSNTSLPETADAARPAQYRPVRLQGVWLPESTVYLNNRPMQGAVGFWVMTPLVLVDGRLVLVQRGWLPRDAQDRLRIAPYWTPREPVEIHGRMALEPSRLMDLGGPGEGPVRQNLTLIEFAADLNKKAYDGAAPPLLPFLVIQTEPESLSPSVDASTKALSSSEVLTNQAASSAVALRRDWPAPAIDVHKHWGYAFQWFSLCALLAVLYVWFQIIQPRRKARVAKAAAARDDGAPH